MVIAITGASGAPIALTVLKGLRAARVPVALVISKGGKTVLREECGLGPETLDKLARDVYADDDLTAPIASGSRRTLGMAVVPCSSNTLARVALGLGDSLITRAAQVHMKEHRRLVVVPRETPLPTVLLKHMTTLAEQGVVVLMAAPPYYLNPGSVDDLTNYLAGKVLDHLQVPHRLYRGWKAPPP